MLTSMEMEHAYTRAYQWWGGTNAPIEDWLENKSSTQVYFGSDEQFLVQNQFLLRKLFKWRSFTLLLLRTEPFLRKRITSRLEDVRLL